MTWRANAGVSRRPLIDPELLSSHTSWVLVPFPERARRPVTQLSASFLFPIFALVSASFLVSVSGRRRRRSLVRLRGFVRRQFLIF